MKHYFFNLAVILSLALAGSASAQTVGPKNQYAPANGGTALISATTASTRSFTITAPPVGQGLWGMTSLWVELTDAGALVSAVAMTCTGTRPGSTTTYKLQSLTTSAGAATSYDASWTKATSGSVNWVWRVDTEGMASINCSLAFTGGAAGASVVVYGINAIKQG